MPTPQKHKNERFNWRRSRWNSSSSWKTDTRTHTHAHPKLLYVRSNNRLGQRIYEGKCETDRVLGRERGRNRDVTSMNSHEYTHIEPSCIGLLMLLRSRYSSLIKVRGMLQLKNSSLEFFQRRPQERFAPVGSGDCRRWSVNPIECECESN